MGHHGSVRRSQAEPGGHVREDRVSQQGGQRRNRSPVCRAIQLAHGYDGPLRFRCHLAQSARGRRLEARVGGRIRRIRFAGVEPGRRGVNLRLPGHFAGDERFAVGTVEVDGPRIRSAGAEDGLIDGG